MLNMGAMLRFAISAILAFTLLAWSQVVLAAAQPVVLVEVPGATPDLREKMRVAAEDGLDSLGVTVPRQLRDPKQEDCTTADCISERSKRFGATHVLEIQGSYVNESYKMRLDVRTVNGGRVLGSESKECEICSSRDFLRAIKDRTVSLWTRVAREQGSVVQPSVATGRESKTTTVPLTAPSSAEQRQHRSLWQQPIPVLGLGLMLGGVVAMGFGGYYLAVDGEPPANCESPCAFERDTKRLGWELMAGGGGALLTGTALVFLGRDTDTSTRVAVGPGRLLVSGRF
jgi:hypothetical protein